MPTIEKKCGRCGETKPVSEFRPDVRCSGGYRGTCKSCTKASRDPDKEREYQRRYRERNPERAAASQARYRERNQEKVRSAALERYREKTSTEEGRAELARQKRAYREKNLDKVNELKRAWYADNKDKHRAATLLKMYGITLAQYNMILEAQGGVCAICKETCHTGRNLAVDHCHATNRVRGLLCGHCNQGIGKFRDDPSRLMAAIDYLTKHDEENDECPTP
ncbi:endonuclease VII domain-containing protein [Streptomyces olivaceus]|uniref:endonuclease VII domain-containing protein n=1 Tax=Streptomyces olivaceus TaxID=47716 RepID=UPI0036AF04F9